MKINRLSLLAFASLSVFSATAYSGASLELGLATDYVREGLQVNQNSPVLQAGVHADHHYGIYAGAWASIFGVKRDIPYEGDLYAGWYVPFSESFAIDAGATKFTFNNDYIDDNNYNEWFLTLIGWDALTLSYRKSNDFMGSALPHQRVQLAYTFNINSFSIDLFAAQNRYLKTNETYNWGTKAKSDNYWHFKIGVVRSYNSWDYRVNLHASSATSNHDGGFYIDASLSRYFQLWQ